MANLFRMVKTKTTMITLTLRSFQCGQDMVESASPGSARVYNMCSWETNTQENKNGANKFQALLL